MFDVTLNKESAAVLLRCLGHNNLSFTQAETEDGVADVIKENTNLIRQQVCKGLAEETIRETAERSESCTIHVN